MYVDGFVLAVPTEAKDAYRRHAEEAAVVFRRHGALSLVEAWGDDVPEGKVNSMHSAVLRKPEETVVFAWVTWPDRATRDEGMKRVFADGEASGSMKNMPFDGTRMIFGGFEVIVDA